MNTVQSEQGTVSKPVIAMDLSTAGKGGGPFTSTTRLMESELKESYEFRTIWYDVSLGAGVSWKRILHLRDQIREIKPDIVHYTGLQLSGFHMAVACRLAGVKRTVVSVRGFSGDALYFSKIKSFLLTYILEPFTLLSATRAVGVSKYVANRKALRILKSKTRSFIYNFPPPVSQSISRDDIRKELKIPADQVVAISVARITKDKGYHIFKDSIRSLSKQTNLTILIVGRGEYLDEMQEELSDQIAKGQVVFLGYKANVGDYLNASDIFVLPTLHETLSVALLEASSYHLALVASNTGGVPEIVIDGHNGRLVEPGNASELSEAIAELVASVEKRKEFGHNAFNRVNTTFDRRRLESQWDELYKTILKEKR
ncbi:glycosyltransferase [Phaeocystidibacter marisrubri]|uniref:Glycosyltransferase family 4 protein n=1 Tax=Phaeocystidibacter marisrubri TaxID=1577780 RepID=A0A6L3ZHW5_9FLAO|nr:glycosyltransferase [Phaeocystidibacter marisrubri]KAB2817606.1 glycosyltransferase family 4 protein [Phaeocystidibacter marisrubri]GGH74525.1 hypothetical protein GCM10011318_20570 [Phaeocystidibacter marisrubri]